ncbi:MAG: sulfatase-like hydrolase/transferase [Reichenbachiella sp.]
MKKISIILTIILCQWASLAQDSPNVLFILADDMGYGDLGVMGHPYAKTPNMDKLASEGKVFTQSYMSGAWCAPSRSALMTGLYPARQFNQTHMIEKDKPTVTRVLNDAGYATAHIGKWHIGADKKGVTGAPPPSDYGIDMSFTTQSNGPGFTSQDKKKEHYREKTTPEYVDLALNFIKESKETPFFLNLWLYPTHSYIDPLPEYLDRFKDLKVNKNDFESDYQRDFLEFIEDNGDLDAAMQAYCADLSQLDDEVGRLLEGLKAMGMEENTIVILSSDNGPGPIYGYPQDMGGILKRLPKKPTLINSVGSAGPFRNRKNTLFEGGIRAPLIVKWPGKVKSGAIDEETVFVGADFMPTVTSLTGVKVPNWGIDGQDISPAILGESQPRQDVVYWSDKAHWAALRDGNIKAHIIRNQVHVYDLQNDIGERNNLALKDAVLAEKYKKMLNDWLSNMYQVKSK